MRAALVTCFLALAAGCAKPNSDIRIDHVIIGVSDLDRGIAQLEQMTGVRPIIGGSHPGRGTRNALMSLGDGTYLELIAPDPGQSVDNEMVRELRALVKPTTIGWAVSGQSTAGLRRLLEANGLKLSPLQPGSRRRPDGSALHWVTFGYEVENEPLLPFFIVWADPALHPSRSSPTGCKLAGIQIVSDDPAKLKRALKPLQLDVAVAGAASDRMQMAVRCNGRRVAID
jgi:hypothetical protein